jgi:hypothetical protein
MDESFYFPTDALSQSRTTPVSEKDVKHLGIPNRVSSFGNMNACGQGLHFDARTHQDYLRQKSSSVAANVGVVIRHQEFFGKHVSNTVKGAHDELKKKGTHALG